MAGNNSIQILRTTNLAASANKGVAPLAGQPLYDEATGKLFVGNGTIAAQNLPAVTAGNVNGTSVNIVSTNGFLNISSFSYPVNINAPEIQLYSGGTINCSGALTQWVGGSAGETMNISPTRTYIAAICGATNTIVSTLNMNYQGIYISAPNANIRGVTRMELNSGGNIFINATSNINLNSSDDININAQNINITGMCVNLPGLYAGGGTVKIAAQFTNITSQHANIYTQYIRLGTVATGARTYTVDMASTVGINICSPNINMMFNSSGTSLTVNSSGMFITGGTAASNIKINSAGAYLNGKAILPFEYIAPVVNNASYRGANTTYIQKRPNYQQFYLMPAIWGLANFSDPNLWYVDLMFDITITGGISGYGSSSYKYYDWSSGRLPIRYYFGWGSVEYHPIGTTTYSVNDDYNPMRYNNSFDFHKRLDLYKGTEHIWVEPSGYSGRLPSSTILNSTSIYEGVAASNCSFSLYGIGPIVRSTSGPIWGSA